MTAQQPPSTDAVQFDGTRIAITSDQPQRVTIEPAGSDLWCPVLHTFIDDYAPRLTAASLKVMLVLFRFRDQATGRTRIDRRDLMSRTLLSKQGLSESILYLERSVPRLLAVHCPSEFEVMPGRTFASRAVRSGEHPSATADNRPPQRTRYLENARAQNQPNQILGSDSIPAQTSANPPDLERASSALVGWVGGCPLGLFGRKALVEGNVRGVLADLGVGGRMLNVAAGIPGLDVDRVLATARDVWGDPKARNKPVCLAVRLIGAAGLDVPTGRRAGCGMHELGHEDAKAAQLANRLEQIRRERMR